MSELRIELNVLSPAERRDLANALLRAAWSAVLEETRILLLGRLSRRRVWKIVHEAASLATERFVARGFPPLPNTTPHSLRRTYVSIALLANNFDVTWVMSQVGHADSTMTTDVYAQLQQRAERAHGKALDALVRRARERLYGAPGDPQEGAESPAIRTRNRTREAETALEDMVDDWREEAERR